MLFLLAWYHIFMDNNYNSAHRIPITEAQKKRKKRLKWSMTIKLQKYEKGHVTWHRNQSNVLVITKCRRSSQNRTTFHFMCSLTSKLGNSKYDWLLTKRPALEADFFKYIYLKKKSHGTSILYSYGSYLW